MRFLLDFLFPPRCVTCGAFGAYLCDQCSSFLQFFPFQLCPACDRVSTGGVTHVACRTPYGLDGLLCISQYAEPMVSLIHAYKYEGVRDASRQIYSIVSQRWPKHAPQLDLLVPIPLHKKRLKERGFNQAELLAQQITQAIHIPTVSALERTQYASSQTTLSRKNRLLQTYGFRCRDPAQIINKRIGLVDDVATTRSTLTAACRELKMTGAAAVWGIVLAHATT